MLLAPGHSLARPARQPRQVIEAGSVSLTLQARYGTVERNREIVRRARDGETFQAIGDDLGITRERVRQIVRRAGVSVKETWDSRRVERTCPHCGERRLVEPSHKAVTCGKRECVMLQRFGTAEPSRHKQSDGHWWTRDPRTGRTMRAERYLMQQHQGRALTRNEWVTLKDGDPDNLTIENIEIRAPGYRRNGEPYDRA